MSAQCAYFVAGTDTEIGKTLVTCASLYVLGQQGWRAAGMKPVAAGATWRDAAWHNEDVDLIAQSANVTLPGCLTAPYLLHDAVAPHIAAAREGVQIDVAHIRDCYRQVSLDADAVVVEGVGGFCVPLSDHANTADLAQQLSLPVILVIGIRLGCLNHALLTAEAIAARGLTLAGWVANILDPGMPSLTDNIVALMERLEAPMLGTIPRLASPLPSLAAAYLDFSRLPGWPKDHPPGAISS